MPVFLSLITIFSNLVIASSSSMNSYLVASAGGSFCLSASKIGSGHSSSYCSSSSKSSSVCPMSALILCTSTCSGASMVTRCTRVQISFLYAYSSANDNFYTYRILLSSDTSFSISGSITSIAYSSSLLWLLPLLSSTELLSSIVITIMLISFSSPTNDITAVIMIASADFAYSAIGILFSIKSK